MKMFWYSLTFLLVVVGTLALLRSIERLIVGSGLMPVQIGIATIFLFLGWLCLKKARLQTSEQK
jgi:hypothetical protein